jgi:hypothetical protein
MSAPGCISKALHLAQRFRRRAPAKAGIIRRSETAKDGIHDARDWR